MALSWGFIGVQFALTGVLRASGNMVIAMMLTLVSQWVLQFPLAYVLSKHTRAGGAGHLVGVPDHERDHGTDHDLRLRERRLEEETPASIPRKPSPRRSPRRY